MEFLLQKEVEVKIENVVDPGSFWVSPGGVIQVTEISRRLKEDEAAGRSLRTKDYCPKPKDLVRVVGENGVYYRGKVVDVEGSAVTVFLIDRGSEKRLEGSSVAPLCGLWGELRPQAVLVGLYGLLPKDISWATLSHPRQLTEKLSCWEEGKGEVESLLKETSRVVYRNRALIDGVPFGSFVVTLDGADQDLAALLIGRNLGILSPNFESDLVVLKHCRLDYIAKGSFRTDIGLPTSTGKKKAENQKEEDLICPLEHLKFISTFCRGEVRPCYTPPGWGDTERPLRGLIKKESEADAGMEHDHTFSPAPSTSGIERGSSSTPKNISKELPAFLDRKQAEPGTEISVGQSLTATRSKRKSNKGPDTETESVGRNQKPAVGASIESRRENSIDDLETRGVNTGEGIGFGRGLIKKEISGSESNTAKSPHEDGKDGGVKICGYGRGLVLPLNKVSGADLDVEGMRTMSYGRGQVLNVSESEKMKHEVKRNKSGHGSDSDGSLNIYGFGRGQITSSQERVSGQYSDADEEVVTYGLGRGQNINKSWEEYCKSRETPKKEALASNNESDSDSSEIRTLGFGGRQNLDPSLEEMKIGFRGEVNTTSGKGNDKENSDIKMYGFGRGQKLSSPSNEGKSEYQSLNMTGFGRGLNLHSTPKEGRSDSNDPSVDKSDSKVGLGRGLKILSHSVSEEERVDLSHPNDDEIYASITREIEHVSPCKPIGFGRGQKIRAALESEKTKSDIEGDLELSKSHKSGLGRGQIIQGLFEKQVDTSLSVLGRGLKITSPSEDRTVSQANETREMDHGGTKVIGRGKKLLDILNEHQAKVGPVSFDSIQSPETDRAKSTTVVTGSKEEGGGGDSGRDFVEPEVKYLTSEFLGGLAAGEESDSESSTSVPAADAEEVSTPQEPTNAQDPLDTLDLASQNMSDCTVGKMLERMKMSGGLLHGDITIRPLSSIYDIQLHPLVVDSMEKKRIKDLTRCQMYVVPVLAQRRSTVLIGPPNSGKSLSYVIPLLSLLLTNAHYSELKDGNGPRCVFVVSSAGSVRYIARLCSAVSAARLQIITTYGGGLELERKDELTNGCDVLITTPRCWLRLLKQKWVTNLARLCHLVIDEADTLFKLFLPEVKEIISLVVRLREVRKSTDVQVVVVGESWTPDLESLVFGPLERPVLCITAHLEAALYARIKPLLFFLTPDTKQSKILDIVDTYKDMRSVVACNNAEEVKYLRVSLSVRRSNVLFAHEEMPPSLLTDVVSSWVSRREHYPLLVCSDEVLNDIGITDARALLNYSLPLSKSVFSNRFSVIKDSFHDRILNSKAPQPDCKVHIFLDETNEEQFPELVNFMSRLSTSIPEKIMDSVVKIKKQKELKKNDLSLCVNLLQFGYCWREARCKDQHIFNYVRDKPRGLPLSGFVKVKILHVLNATHYCVRLLAHSESDMAANSWTKLPSNYPLIGLKLSNFYANRDNRRPFGRVRVGDVVGVEVETDILFFRARVIDITARDEKCNPTNVKIIYVDEGGELEEKSVIDLLRLPVGLEELEGESVDLYLARLVPVDLDPAWSYASTSAIRKAVNQHDQPDNFFVAKIALSTGRTLLVDPLQCFQQLELNKCNIVHLSLRHFILKSKLAVHNPDHIVNLHSLAKEAGLQVPSLQTQDASSAGEGHLDDDEDNTDEAVQWAHLNSDDFTLVNIVYIESPSLFFLRTTKFHDRLKELQKDLTKEMETQKRVIKTHHIKPGKICVTKSPDSPNWNRAMVVEVVGEDEVEVFYVDHGDLAVLRPEELFRIPKQFVQMMPFQAIEAELVGVKPMDEEGWLPEATDVMYDLSTLSDDIWRNFYAKVCVVKDKGELSGGHHYSVILIDTTDDLDVVMNKEMVYRGFANWDSPTSHHLAEAPEGVPQVKLPPPKVKNEDLDDDELLLTEEDQMMIEESRKIGNTEIASGDDNNEVPSNIDEALGQFETGDFEINLDIDQLFPYSSAYLVKLLPNVSDVKSILDGMNKGEKMGAIEAAPSSESSLPIGEGPSESGNEADVSDLGDRLTTTHSTPTIMWHQSNTHVHIKVDLPSLTKYSLKWSFRYICFGAVLEDKLYKFHVDLFGPVEPETLEHHPRGLTLDIKVEKTMKGHDWPRLMYKKMKAPWVRLNPDHVKKEDECTLVDNFYKRGIQGIEEGIEIESVEATMPCMSDQESDASSDLVEFSDIPFDPYDPLC